MIYITKASGERDEFSEEKIRISLRRSGATEEQIDRIVREISGQLYEGITTKQIYRIAFGLLKKNARPTAARYHLKKAIMELGPSGFPFEKFIAELLSRQGYRTKTDQILQGKCITHEIDVIAENNNHYELIECKFHNQAGKINDVQLPLYVRARFNDVLELLVISPEHANRIYSGRIVTNTRFSSDAIRYGNCAGIKLLGWDYPAGAALRELIDSLGLYPITCLTSLSTKEKQDLLSRKIVLCGDLHMHQELLEELHIKAGRLQVIKKELEELCVRTQQPVQKKAINQKTEMSGKDH